MSRLYNTLCAFDGRFNQLRYLRKRVFKAPILNECMDIKMLQKREHDNQLLEEERSPLEEVKIQKNRYKLKRTEEKSTKLHFNHIPIQDQVVVMFPGHGTQHLKMGEKVIDNPSSLLLFEEANEKLQFNLLDLCLNGPKTKLDQTFYAQIALFVSSLAAFEKLKTEQSDLRERLTDCAGFSLGEMCSLVAAEVISFTEALKIIQISAESTQKCCQMFPSGMITIRTTAKSQLHRALEESRQYSKSKGEPPVCEIANYLYCHVKVIGGTQKSLEYFVQNAEQFKIQVIKRLPINGAFHTILMKKAADEVDKFLANVEIKAPRINVFSNYTGKPHEFKAQIIKRNIARQIRFPVRWEQIAYSLFLKHKDYNFPSYFEVGPGKQLGTILYQICKKTRKTYLNYPP